MSDGNAWGVDLVRLWVVVFQEVDINWVYEQTKERTIGCSNLKQLVESDKIIIEDFDIINELSTYIVHGSSFQAEEGCNDDLVMCCVLFAWATDQTYFKELTDSDIRAQMYKDQQNQIEQDIDTFDLCRRFRGRKHRWCNR